MNGFLSIPVCVYPVAWFCLIKTNEQIPTPILIRLIENEMQRMVLNCQTTLINRSETAPINKVNTVGTGVDK